MTIGQRATMAIKERAWANNTKFETECFNLDVTSTQMRSWQRGKSNPCARVLANMYLEGYDIIYILTGEQHGKT